MKKFLGRWLSDFTLIAVWLVIIKFIDVMIGVFFKHPGYFAGLVFAVMTLVFAVRNGGL